MFAALVRAVPGAAGPPRVAHDQAPERRSGGVVAVMNACTTQMTHRRPTSVTAWGSQNELHQLKAKFHYTDTDPTGPARTFFAAKLRWVRAGPVGSV